MSPTRIANLSLWKQHCGQVPESVWEQSDLETLVLADNDLTEISERIGHLTHLRMLDLGHNALRSLPECAGSA
jgi:Leucine-rich repeat (LRR) protein